MSSPPSSRKPVHPSQLVDASDVTPHVERSGRWLVASFPRPMRLISWAVVGGGAASARQVAWYQVADDELRPPVDAAELLRAKLASRGLADAVGLLTSADLGLWSSATRSFGDERAGAVATVGMGNALRIGDEPSVSGRIGTINVLCWTSAPLTRAAQLEALSLTAEARTAAVIEAGIPSRRSGKTATGTGTDCIVVACPPASVGKQYAGKHTTVGHVVGAAVYDAVAHGLSAWQLARRGDGARSIVEVGLGG